MPASPPDTWASGDAYERYVGRWSRPVARQFLAWLGVGADSRWLDVGCGTGALSETILEVGAPKQVKGVDRSEPYIAHARQRIRNSRATFEVGDAQSLSDDTASYDAAVSALTINFIAQPERAVGEMARVVKPGGTVACYVWDYAGKMDLMRYFWDAATGLDAGAFDLDEGRRFPLCQPDALRELFQSAGLHNIEGQAIDVATLFRDFDDYWSPFLGGQGPAPSYAMSLSDERRVALRERLRSRLPYAPDGSIPLAARAWAVRGLRK